MTDLVKKNLSGYEWEWFGIEFGDDSELFIKD